MLNSEISHTRTPTHKINSLFVNRWSPRSMKKEDVDDNMICCHFLKLLDGRDPHLIISHGGLSMQQEILIVSFLFQIQYILG
jgi:hypothetical protein